MRGSAALLVPRGSVAIYSVCSNVQVHLQAIKLKRAQRAIRNGLGSCTSCVDTDGLRCLPFKGKRIEIQKPWV